MEDLARVMIWGTGCMAGKVLGNNEIFEKYDVVGFIDNDPCKQGRKFYGKNIYAPDILSTLRVDKIVILIAKYEEVYRQIIENFELKNTEIEDWRYFDRELIVKQGILKRYENTDDLEIWEVLEYIKRNELRVFNYPFREKYRDLNVSAVYDTDCNMFYVMHRGKRMYFARSLDHEAAVIAYYKSILLEQDKDSPHRYLDERFNVRYGDIVVDGGVAEGNFALEIIDRVSKVYLIEADKEWVDALKETFKKYQDKVVIIQKYLTSIDDDSHATLDQLIEEPVDFLKMDIEGNEWDALLGAKKLIGKSKNIRCAICSYHAEYDETLMKATLSEYGLRCTATHGYMWFLSWGRDGNISTKLRRGIVRATV